jgi:protoheme IX farnesyltransferase
MRVFNYSIIYLMALFAFLLVDHWLPGAADADPAVVFQRIG